MSEIHNPDSRGPNRKKKAILLLVLGIVAISLGLLLLILHLLGVGQGPEPLGVIDRNVLLEIPYDQLPEDALYITQERRQYAGQMRLLIPSIEVDTPVGLSTESEGLSKMPGLYEFSQMPPEEDGNVSIAGHRDIHNMEFYSLDKMEKGDFLYLIYNGSVYQYLYTGTEIVQSDDWDVIKRQGYTCLTLTTCDPIGTSLNRLIVTGEQIDEQPYTDGFEFTMNEATGR